MKRDSKEGVPLHFLRLPLFQKLPLPPLPLSSIKIPSFSVGRGSPRIKKKGAKLTELSPPRMETTFSDCWPLNRSISRRGEVVSAWVLARFTAVGIDLPSGFVCEESGWNQKTGLVLEPRLPKLLTELGSQLNGLHE